jgi:cytochrome c2
MARDLQEECMIFARRGAMALVLTLAAAGCSGEAFGFRSQQSTAVPGGSPERGRQAISRYGCGACHTIAGVPRAQGKVGPRLADLNERVMIAGRLANTPDNLVHWIEEPQSVSPGTAMPNLGVTDADARDIAAYLLTLR